MNNDLAKAIKAYRAARDEVVAATKAIKAYRAARDEVVAATKAAFPIGAVVTVGFPKPIQGRVESTGHWGDRPAMVGVRNLRTGKMRYANAAFHEITVIQP